MKKLIAIIVALSFVAFPTLASIQKATLINSTGKKVVVEVGSEMAQVYFGLGYELMGTKNIELGGMGGNARNVIGTRVSTTTTGVAWGAATSTVRYPTFIGTDVDSVTYYLQTTAAVASSSVVMNLFTSNDQYCTTATTTTVLNTPTVSEIDWYDAAYLIKDLAGSATIDVATTSVTWYPKTAKLKKTITLTDLNTRCVALEVTSADTSLYAQLTTKQY